jgi:hypothetical protein
VFAVCNGDDEASVEAKSGATSWGTVAFAVCSGDDEASVGARTRLARRVQGTPWGMVVSASCGDEGEAHSSAVRPVTMAT